MSMGKGVHRNNTFDDEPFSELTSGAESEMETDAHEVKKEGENGYYHSEDDEFALRFEGNMNPLDFTQEDAFGSQPYERFERLEYETLAERKRKALADPKNEKSTKKSKQEDISCANFEELMESMSNRRKLKRKEKKRGRPKGSRNKVNPEITKMLGDGTLLYSSGRYTEAISVLNEVVRLAPNWANTYHTLGLVYGAIGDKQKSMSFYMLAAVMKPRNSSLWKLLLSWSMELGNMAQARYCLYKAISADPEDIELRFHRALLYIEIGDYEKAAKSYEEISQIWPDNVESYMEAAKLYQASGKVERSVDILESYIKSHKADADVSVVDLLVEICMKNNEYVKALQYIEEVGRELPPHLTAKEGICYLHLGNMKKADGLFRVFQSENFCKHADLITDIADSFKSLEKYESALGYYLNLDRNLSPESGNLYLKIAQCYLALKDRERAIQFFYKALNLLGDTIDARLTLASLLLEDQKECEAIALLSRNESELMVAPSCNESKPWWLNEEIKLKLAKIYQAKKMVEEFVDLIFPPIHESLTIETTNKEIKPKKKLSTNVLLERLKVLDDPSTDNVFHGFRPTASASVKSKARRAKESLQKKSTLKEKMKAEALAAGLTWQSDDSDDELPCASPRKPPLPQLVKNEENHQLIIDLCYGLASLGRFKEALDIIRLILPLASNEMSSDKKYELTALGAKMEYKTMVPSHRYEFVQNFVEQSPYSIPAWNYYYKVISKSELHHKSKRHSEFLNRVRKNHEDCLPSMILSGHQFTANSKHQSAARAYLEAYKLLPDSPIINLCVGTALINLALNSRLHNKHLCVAQGLAFLHNNVEICGDYNSQEAMCNIARAFHHVGIVSLAVSYYENVLTTHVKDYPIPRLPYENPDATVNRKPGYCSIKREAAYNLHLIYRSSGAFDLARQVLQEHCTL